VVLFYQHTTTHPVFSKADNHNHIKLFNGVLRSAKLKFDCDNNPQTAYSLRRQQSEISGLRHI
jgi:hypothetical protein